MNISVPDELAEQVRTLKIPISTVCQKALRDAVETALLHDQQGMEEIVLDVGRPPVRVGFIGRWLLAPDREAARHNPAGMYFGIAVTKRGRIAVYAAHATGAIPPTLDDFDSLDEAEAAGIPTSVTAVAAGGLAPTERVLWRDI